MAKMNIQIRIDPDLLNWVDEKAGLEDRSRSWIINDRLRKDFQRDNGSRPTSITNPRN